MTGDCVRPWREIGRFKDKKDVVRACECESLYPLDVLGPSTVDPKLIVCLGTQLICRHQGFLGTTKQDETKENTSAGTTPALTQEETLMQTEALCVQESKN